MSELFTDIKTGIKERISGPFFGYIFVSFIFFNWDWIYFFIFSHLSAEQKLNTINNTYKYFRGFAAPVISGFSMCLLVPFINVFIKKLHSIAVRIAKEIDFDNDNSLEEIKADRELQLSIKRQQASVIKSEVDNLENTHQTLSDSVRQMQRETANLLDKQQELMKEEQKITLAINDAKINLKSINATKENFDRLSSLVNDKNKENVNLKNNIDDLNLALHDISLFLNEKEGSSSIDLPRAQRVGKFLEKYGYNTKEKIEELTGTFQKSLVNGLQGLDQPAVTNLQGFGQPTTTALKGFGQPTATALKGFGQPTATALKGFDQPTATALKGFGQPTATALKGFGQPTVFSLQGAGKPTVAIVKDSNSVERKMNKYNKNE